MSSKLDHAKELRKKGKFSEAINLIEEVLSSGQFDDPRAKTICLNEFSHNKWQIGQLDDAEQYANEALLLSTEFADNLGQKNALHNLGVVMRRKGKIDKAINFLNQSLKIQEEVKDKPGIATILNNLGNVYWQKGNLEIAEEYHHKSLTIRKQLGNPFDISASLNNLGVIYWQKGQFEKAVDFYNKALIIDKEIENPKHAITLHNIGIIHSERGHLKEAENAFQKSLSHFNKANNLEGEASALNNLGVCYLRMQDLIKAKINLNESLRLYNQLGNKDAIAEVYYQLALIELLSDSIQSAENQINKLAEVAKDSQLEEIELRYVLATGWLNLKKHELSSALKLGVRAKELAIKIPYFELEIEAIQLLLQGSLQLYSITNNIEHEKRIETLCIELEELSKRERLHSAYVETKLIRGLLKQAKFDLEDANLLFRAAKKSAEKRGITRLIQKAQQQIDQLQKKLLIFQNLQEISPQAYENAQFKEILSYLKEAQVYLRQTS